uniref:Uncharacterized protein n=1 Tax=Anthurium amnicola TaxID=1678845 RepID=A0A1D1YD36_9ARAE
MPTPTSSSSSYYFSLNTSSPLPRPAAVPGRRILRSSALFLPLISHSSQRLPLPQWPAATKAARRRGPLPLPSRHPSWLPFPASKQFSDEEEEDDEEEEEEEEPRRGTHNRVWGTAGALRIPLRALPTTDLLVQALCQRTAAVPPPPPPPLPCSTSRQVPRRCRPPSSPPVLRTLAARAAAAATDTTGLQWQWQPFMAISSSP